MHQEINSSDISIFHISSW